MPTTQISGKLGQAAKDVLRTLLYFDLFSYPLTLEEIYNASTIGELSESQFRQAVNHLEAAGYIFQNEHLWGLHPDHPFHHRRLSGNQMAAKYLPVARRISRYIGAFPFVRAVFLSGSISKHCMTPGADIDYFIITEPRRLWVARTMLVLFKKIFLLNSHKYFCVNYFIDTDHLEIEEKNQFTATEIVHLIPTYGREFYDPFRESNRWTAAYFPRFSSRYDHDIPASQVRGIKWLGEKVLSGKLGEWLDSYLMKKTIGFWNRKFRFMGQKEIDIALKSRTYVSKHHPQNFQARVLEGLKQKIADFEQKHGIELH
ncbi:MAG: nucleotidyltransferase domain-containing protein [Bacteroidia bacterium]